jgi:Ca-activated chloride channel family protein
MHGDFRKSRLGLIWIAIFMLPGAASKVESQDTIDPRRIQIESALVAVPVIVRDLHGKFIPGLRADSFRLFQDGVRVPFSLFLTSEDPIRIALLLDTSKSTTTVLGAIKKAAKRFLLQMRPLDQAMVVSFDSDIQILCALSSDQRELEEGIKSAKAGGTGTRMRDAIVEIAQRKFQSISGRKAVVLLTDGQDHGSSISSSDLFDAIAASSTLVYSVFYSVDPRELAKELFGVSSRLPRRAAGKIKGAPAAWDENEEKAARYLQQISELSAGRFYRSTSMEFDSIFKQISEELRSQYLIGFYPDKLMLDGIMHSLEVKVSVPEANVSSRRNYRATR